MGVVLAATVGVLIALPAAGDATLPAGTTPCNSTISNQSLQSVYVPAGQTCTLTGDTISGSIIDWGTLNLTPDGPIGGNVTANPGSQFFETGNWQVNGTLTFNGVSSFSLAAATVGGNLGIEHESFSLSGMVVDGSVNMSDNGVATFGGNTVGNNISCSGNNPAPTNGGNPNTVGGVELGQCANLH
jgi:hypothetical protein